MPECDDGFHNFYHLVVDNDYGWELDLCAECGRLRLYWYRHSLTIDYAPEQLARRNVMQEREGENGN